MNRTAIFILIATAALTLAAPVLFQGVHGRVAAGLAARAGVVDAPWLDQAAAATFLTAGWPGAGAILLLPAVLGWGVVLALMAWIAIKCRARRWLPLLLGIALAAGVWRTTWAGVSREDWPAEVARREMLDQLRLVSGRVFANPSGALDFAPSDPEIIGSLPFDERYERLSSVSLWRDAERTSPSAAVLLAGRLTEARRILEHLQASPDWHLAFVNAAGLLWVRGPGNRFSPPAPSALGANLPTGQRARLLAATALRFEDAGLRTAARALVHDAMELVPSDPGVLAASASIAASQGRWERARSLAERALKSDPRSTQARFILISAELQIGSPATALAEARRLVRQSARDPQALWLMARAARAARDPMTEIETLERLLAITPPGSAEAGRIQIFLGQAWAQRGFPDQSLKAYRAALEAPLNETEAAEVREAIATVEANRLPSGG